jgi:hypothetical protein
MDCALTFSTVPSVPFFTPSPRILQEHDAIPAGEVSRAAFDGQADVIPQITRSPHPFARRLVQRANFVFGVGEDDPASVRCGLPVTVPAVDQIAARPLPGLCFMHHVVGAIGFKCISGPAGRQIARSVALPVLPLATDLAKFRASVALMDRPERCACLDGLQLLRIADQHDFRAGFCSMG